MAKDRWYRDGLAFECTGCGKCCSGPPGFVWISDAEIAALAIEMNLPMDDFEHKFVRQIGLRKSLVEYPDGDCIFLEPRTRKCMVYEARPIQCRTWPFWPSNIRRRTDWDKVCEICPGSGHGRVYSMEEIEIQRSTREV